MNEENTIRRARAGDEAAWAALAERHQEAVFRFAYLHTGDADEAADVAQETFIRAFRHIDRFDAARPLRPWLLQIAKNLTRNRQRAARRYLAAVRRWLDTQPRTVHPPPAAALEDDATLLWHAVRRLSPQDQDVIYLRYFLELSVAESAQVLDVAPGTVKSRLSRALDRLQRTIEAEFPELQPVGNSTGVVDEH